MLNTQPTVQYTDVNQHLLILKKIEMFDVFLDRFGSHRLPKSALHFSRSILDINV